MEETANELRKRFNKRFYGMFPRNTGRQGLGVLALDFGTILVAIIFAESLSTNGDVVYWLGYVLACVVIGTRQRSFGNIVHECSHAGFVADRRLNDVVGRFLSTLLCYSYDCYRDGHKTHHIYTGDYEKDEDFANTKAYEFHQPISGEIIRRHLVRLFTFQFFPYYTGKTVFTNEDRPRWLFIRLLYVAFVLYGLVGIWSEWSGSALIVWYWVVPYVTVLPVIGYVSDLFDHAGLIGNDNEIDKSRNYPVSNRFFHWLFFPRHDSYHLVHHLFPMVPTKHLAACHEILMAESPYYAARPHSLVEWFSDKFFQVPHKLVEYEIEKGST